MAEGTEPKVLATAEQNLTAAIEKLSAIRREHRTIEDILREGKAPAPIGTTLTAAVRARLEARRAEIAALAEETAWTLGLTIEEPAP